MGRLRAVLKALLIPGAAAGVLLSPPAFAAGPPPAVTPPAAATKRPNDLPPLPDPAPLPPPAPPDGLPPLPPPGSDGKIQLVQQPPITSAEQTTAPAGSGAQVPTGLGSLGGNPFGSVGGGGAAAAATIGAATAGAGEAGGTAAAVTGTQSNAIAAPAASAVSGVEAQTRATSDLGDLLGKSLSSLGVETQHRDPIITDVRVRGYHVGELTTVMDGAFYFPARYDLDTIVSKIDSSIIRDVVVVKGPYSVRYGPGFAFLDVETLGSPRFTDGFEAHGSTSLMYKTNGDQWHGRQSVWGGSDDWGFRLGYDLMAGADYEDGAGQHLPSGYNSQNIDFAFGFDLSPDSSVEIRAIRQDQHDVQLPGQVFDIRTGYTDAFTGRYVLRNQDYFNLLTADVWYNQVRFNGDNLSPAKQEQLFALTPNAAFQGVTDGNTESLGYRLAVTWGEDKHAQVTAGSDLRYLTQRLSEFDTIFGITADFPIPRAHLIDPGVFLDGTLPLFDNKLILKAGARADWASANIDSLDFDPTTLQQVTNTLGPGPYGRTFDLWSTYLSAELKLTEHWSLLSGFGEGLRPPSLTELYASGPVLAVVQNGLNVVNGNPLLNPEQAQQMDLGLRADYETFRFGLSGFYSWIHDYITFAEVAPASPPFQANVIQFVNTNRATLSGFETYAEWDVYEWLTPFVTMEYVEGRDYTRNFRGLLVANGMPLAGSASPQEPLPGMPPLESRLGFRIHDRGKNPRWGVEALARMVAGQHRIAESLGEQATRGFTIFNVRAFWRVTKNVMLTSGVENLGNRQYREALDLRTGLGVYQPGVDFYFGAQVTY